MMNNFGLYIAKIGISKRQISDTLDTGMVVMWYSGKVCGVDVIWCSSIEGR